MSQGIINTIMEDPSPTRILRAVHERLAREQSDREAFRNWLRPDLKAEFINGKRIMHSPARREHNQTVKLISNLLEAYAAMTDAGEIAIEKAMVGLERNDVEPDICFWKQSTAKDFTANMLVYPAPDLIVEVLSKSTESRDRGVKKDAYELDGVREYWIVDAAVQTVEQYVLNSSDGKYALLKRYGVKDSITCFVLAELTLSVKAFFDKEDNLRERRALYA